MWKQFCMVGGAIDTVWVQVTNPGQTLPNLASLFRPAEGLPGKFLIVSDVYPTATTALADLVLPSAMWVEKNGMFGNSERRTQQWFRMVPPPGEARDDCWQTIAVSHRLLELGYPGMKDKDGGHRAERRAFDGAPPTIPHTVDERSTSACLACHGQGLVIADRIAPPMSHAFYTNCTQCHVPMQKPMVETAAAPPFESSFAPLRSQPGERFAPGAPPAMPHTTFMRQTCVSCHGPLGGAGLRTTHVKRVSCHQCHAISNALEQHPGGP